MSNHIALLRGINVGGHNLIAMSELRNLFAGLGFAGAESLLQSGNVVFQSRKRSIASLERLLEVETEKRLRVRADYTVRTSDEWQSVVDRNPLRDEAERNPSHFLVVFFKESLDVNAVHALRAAIKGPEIVHADDQQLYVAYPAGMGRSKLTNALIEKKLGCRGTGRNWNTVLKLAALIQD